MSKQESGKQSSSTDEDEYPKGLEDLVGYNLRLAYNAQVQRFAAVGGAHKIRPSQFAILKLIYCNPRLRQGDLAKAVKRKHTNTVTMLDELESRKLIARVADPTDKRSRELHLTPAGRKLTEKLLERHARLERNLRREFGSDRLDELIRLLDAFRRLDSQPNID